MRTRTTLGLARADFLERVRRPSFLLILLFATFLGYEVVAGNVVVRMNDLTGAHDWAWTGALITVVANTFLSLAGFYLCRGGVSRDIDSGVGEILAATPLRRGEYVLGKALSNLAVLLSMLGVLALFGLGMIGLAGTATGSGPVDFLIPLLVVGLPAMALTAAVAVLFEVSRTLRGTFGSVAYFLLVWPMLVSTPWLARLPVHGPIGIDVFAGDMQAAARRIDPSVGEAFAVSAGPQPPLRTFVWDGLDWTPDVLLGRAVWLLFATAVLVLAALLFARFDERRDHDRRSLRDRLPSLPLSGEISGGGQPSASPATSVSSARAELGELRGADRRPARGRLLWQEIRLQLAGLPWWGIAGLGILNTGALLGGRESLVLWLPALWLAPVLVWSRMGIRERVHATEELLFSAPAPLRRQLTVQLGAGIVITAAFTLGHGARGVLSAEPIVLVTWLTAVVTVPATALALGAWSGTPRLFEALYTLAWYIGPAHQVPALDYLGTAAGMASRIPWILLLGALSISLAFLGRRRRLRRH